MLDAVGAQATRATALELLRPGGQAVYIGLAADDTTLGFHDVVRGQLGLRGSYAYTMADFEQALEWLVDGRASLGDAGRGAAARGRARCVRPPGRGAAARGGQGVPRRRRPRGLSVAALDGRTALVTGASSGIGLATALAFADAGAHVHAAARRPELIEEAAGGRDVVAHHVDVTDRATVAALAERVAADGPLHALVAAAGTNLKERRPISSRPPPATSSSALNLTGVVQRRQRVPPAAARDARRRRADRQRLGQLAGPLRRGLPGLQGGGQRLRARRGLRGGAAACASRRSCPGVVDTAILDQRPEPSRPPSCAHGCCTPDDVAAACLFAVALPARAHVPELTILPTDLQALGRTA